MVIYHTAFDLSQFYGWDIDVFDGGWRIFARMTAIVFLLLVGVGAVISDERVRQRGTSTAMRWKRHVRRFIVIGAGALVVSAATYIVDPHTYVRFGILHVIAVGALIVPGVMGSLGRSAAPLPIGIAIVAMGLWIQTIQTDSPWLYIFGTGHGIPSVDYFPIFPWMGVVFVGYGVGWWVYVKKRLNVNDERRHAMASLQTLSWPGRHALLCYLLHQPIIIAVLWLVMGKPTF